MFTTIYNLGKEEKNMRKRKTDLTTHLHSTPFQNPALYMDKCIKDKKLVSNIKLPLEIIQNNPLLSV